MCTCAAMVTQQMVAVKCLLQRLSGAPGPIGPPDTLWGAAACPMAPGKIVNADMAQTCTTPALTAQLSGHSSAQDTISLGCHPLRLSWAHLDTDGTHAGPATAVRDAECLVQVQVAHVRANVPRRRQADLQVTRL